MPVSSEFSSVLKKTQEGTFLAVPNVVSIKRIMGAVKMGLKNLARCLEATPMRLLHKSGLLSQKGTQARW